MDTSDDRVSELIAAALAGELSPDEAAEFDALRATHPWIDNELASLGGVAERVTLADVSWSEVRADTGLRDRIAASIADEGSARDATAGVDPGFVPSALRPVDAPGSEVSSPSARRSRGWFVPLLGAACLVIGLGVGLIAPGVLSTVTSGPPGTLGAIESVTVRDEPAGTQIEADLVAHTWGTEAVLDATGLNVGATYSIVFIGTDGAEFSAGEMLGSSVAIHCRVNAAVLREDVVRLEIRQADGVQVAVADIPPV